jgi:hypothetical protein
MCIEQGASMCAEIGEYFSLFWCTKNGPLAEKIPRYLQV